MENIIMGMHINRRVIPVLLGFLCIGFLLACAKSPPYDAIPAPVTQESGDAALAELLNSIRLEERLPGLAAAIIIDSKLHSVAAVGARESGTDNWLTVNDKFLISSCAKAFTATTAAILVEEGRLSWQTTIRDAFPDLNMLPEYENITIQQLLSHRAGLPKNLKEGTTWLTDYGFDKKRGSAPELLRLQYLEQTVKNKLISPPGKVIHYSNSGYILAGAILEKIAGRTYEEILEEKIITPLDLATAGYGLPAALEPTSQPWGHYWDKSKNSFVALKVDYPNFFAPVGYIHMSIKDWAKFIIVHLNSDPSDETKLLKSSSLQFLHTPPDSAEWDFGFKERMGSKFFGYGYLNSNYALGWFTKEKDKGYDLIYHGGRGFAFNAMVLADLKTKNAILLITNTEVSHVHPTVQNLLMIKKIKKHYSKQVELPFTN
jgi:CubicO group peptidase (beta-lactamase class C family)